MNVPVEARWFFAGWAACEVFGLVLRWRARRQLRLEFEAMERAWVASRPGVAPGPGAWEPDPVGTPVSNQANGD